MVGTAILENQVKLNGVNGKTRRITWADFEKKYLSREDGFKYEWVNGEVVKSRHMDYTQLFIVRNLREVFELLRSKSIIHGLLETEIDSFFDGNHRRPDLAYFSNEQLARTAHGQNQVPQFVVEIISKRDQMDLVHEKMEDYRRAGVQVVWHIFPRHHQVHVYTGDDLREMKVCKNEDICSANVVLPDFEMTAAAVFQKPPLPV